MASSRTSFRRRRRWAGASASLTALAAGGALVAGFAAARTTTHTLSVATGASVTNAVTGVVSHENVVISRSRRAVYTLSGETARHLKCSAANGCFAVWPPVTVAAHHKPTAVRGIKGKLGTIKRGRLIQVTLSGHPLYTYIGDVPGGSSSYDGFKSFGGTWRVVVTGTPAKTVVQPAMTTATTPGPVGYGY